MKVLVTGGAGYIGALLVPQLLSDGHEVTVYDTMWLGSGHLPKDNGNLTIIKGDVRDQVHYRLHCVRKDAIIYLASVSNNAMYDKNYDLTTSVNTGCFNMNVKVAKASGVKLFIYASSVAAYGVTDKPANEDNQLGVSSHYGNAKAGCEGIVKAYQDDNFTTVRVRSASVCGYSPNMRFDTTINMMVNHAYRKGKITVNGGEQYRTHVHIQDLCDFYRLLLTLRDKALFGGQAFNVVCGNQKVIESARLVKSVFQDHGKYVDLEVGPPTDDRSYMVSGNRALVLGFAPKRDVRNAITDLYLKFASGYWKDSLENDIYQNLITGIE